MKTMNLLSFSLLIRSFFRNNVAGVAKTSALGLMTAFVSLSCDSDDSGNPDPEPEMVHSITGEITGMQINVGDSTITIYMGTWELSTRVILSAKKDANGGKVNLDAPLLADENLIPEVGMYGLRLLGFKDLNKPLTISSAEEGKKYIGYGTNNNDKIDVLAAESFRGTLGYAGIEAYPRSSHEITLEDIVGIITQPLKLIGEEAKGIGGKTSNGAEKTYKMTIN